MKARSSEMAKAHSTLGAVLVCDLGNGINAPEAGEAKTNAVIGAFRLWQLSNSLTTAAQLQLFAAANGSTFTAASAIWVRKPYSYPFLKAWNALVDTAKSLPRTIPSPSERVNAA